MRPLEVATRIATTAGICGLLGCNLLAYPLYLAAPEPTKKVPAEFNKLQGKRVAIVVWAKPETLFQFPHVRLEVAAQVAWQLQQKVKNVQVVQPQLIADYQDRHPEWEGLPPAEIGKRFGADYVIFVELLEYTTRDPRSPTLYRGRARAGIVVYDVADPARKWPLNPVTAEYPGGPVGVAAADDMAVHRGLLDLLGRKIAQKFYDHEIVLEKA